MKTKTIAAEGGRFDEVNVSDAVKYELEKHLVLNYCTVRWKKYHSLYNEYKWVYMLYENDPSLQL